MAGENLRKNSDGSFSCKQCIKDRTHRIKIEKIKSGMQFVGIGGRNRNKTHCPKGHEYTKENTLSAITSKNSKRPSRRCIECLKVSQTIRGRKSRLLKIYGLTLEDYENIKIAQGGVCAICKKPQDPKFSYGKLDVDHDHVTNKVRGLLCNPCNFGLGVFNDDIDIIQSAIDYLKRSKIE